MQRYISNELTHFLGRSLPSDEARYELLLKVIRNGFLTHPPHNPNIRNFSSMTVGEGVKVSENDLYAPGVICFCDIPIADFKIHTQKYGPFGISFRKPFLIRRGANPVFYVARESRVRQSLMGKVNRAEFFDRVVQDYQRYTHRRNENQEGQELLYQEWFHRFRRLFELHFLGLVKFFDSNLPEDHPENYYMEREWRLMGMLEFRINDVERIILPRSFGERLRKDLPDFAGQVTFI